MGEKLALVPSKSARVPSNFARMTSNFARVTSKFAHFFPHNYLRNHLSCSRFHEEKTPDSLEVPIQTMDPRQIGRKKAQKTVWRMEVARRLLAFAKASADT